MVALSLIEAGMPPEDAVLFIRERRKGAINSRFTLIPLFTSHLYPNFAPSVRLICC